MVSSDLSTNANSRSPMSPAGSRSSLQMATAVCTVAPAGNTASRSASSRSSGASRSQLHSTTARSVRWRGMAVRLPPVSSRNRLDSRAAISPIGITRSRAAASSMASGRPSSRRTISVTWATVVSSTQKPALTACARSISRRTAGWSIASTAETPTGGRPSGGSTQSASPTMPSGSRLVVRMRTSGQPASSWSMRTATGPIRCSQLSTSSRQSASASTSNRYSVGVRAARRPDDRRPARRAARGHRAWPAGWPWRR